MSEVGHFQTTPTLRVRVIDVRSEMSFFDNIGTLCLVGLWDVGSALAEAG